MPSAFDQEANKDQTDQTNEQSQSVLATLVGEDKKFKTTEDLAKAKAESDAFIEQLKSEQAGLREELEKRMTSEEVLAKIREDANSAASAQDGSTNSPLSQEDIAELVKTSLESNRTKELSDRNLQAVDDKMVQLYGDKAKDEVTKKAAELGVSVEFLAGVAQQSPKAFFSTVGINVDNQQAPNVTQGGVNTEVLKDIGGSAPAAGTKAYFDAIRDSDKKTYWSPKTQNEIMQARAAGTYVV